MLLGLGLLAFWMHREPGSFDQRQTMYAARSDLRPVVGAATTPSGGGMAENVHAAVAGAAADAAAAALGAQSTEQRPASAA